MSASTPSLPSPDDSGPQRLFFALWPSPHAVESLAGVARDCALRFGGRPTRAETVHMTLAFLGEQPDARFSDIVAAASSVAFAPFDLKLDRLGAPARLLTTR